MEKFGYVTAGGLDPWGEDYDASPGRPWWAAAAAAAAANAIPNLPVPYVASNLESIAGQGLEREEPSENRQVSLCESWSLVLYLRGSTGSSEVPPYSQVL